MHILILKFIMERLYLYLLRSSTIYVLLFFLQSNICEVRLLSYLRDSSSTYLVAVVREKDVCWEYCDKLDGNKVRCKFCLKVLNGGISRLKHHLSRLPSKGVLPCSKVRDDVSDRVKAIIACKEEVKEAASAKKQRTADVKSPISMPVSKSLIPMEASPLAKPFPSVPQVGSSSSYDREEAERSIALFFFENKLDFSVAHSSSYQSMMDAVAKCGHGFKGPSSESLKTTWLERIKFEVNEKSKQIERDWATTGCTIIADTWTDNKSKALINFLVSSPSGTFFLKSVDASPYFKSNKCLADLFLSAIQDIGPENVVQVIMDGTLNCVGAHSYITKAYGTIYITPCASHCLNLILEDFCKIDWVSRCILQAQSISKFIYNHTWVLDLMRKCTGCQELVLTSISKPASNFLSLQSMLKHRSRLKLMFNSPDYTTNPAYPSKQSTPCIAILEDNNFWKAVEESVAISEPFLKVLREVAGGKPTVGSIYEYMTKAKESIRTYYIMDENKCKTFSDIVDRRWMNQLHSPLHSAAAFLNPSIQYNPEVKFLISIKEQFLQVLERLLPTPDLRHDITNQIFVFRKAQGMFGCNLAQESRTTISPGFWWDQYGDSAPGLQRVAIRILSQVCSASTFVRDWIAFQHIHSETRNRLEKDTLGDLLYINYNLKLTSRMKGKPVDADPILIDEIDMTSDWVGEIENPNPTQWFDLDGGDLNTRQFTTSMFGASDSMFG